MSKIVVAIFNFIFHSFYVFVLGETDGSLERKTGKTKKFTESEQKRFKFSRQLVTKANVWLLRISMGRLGNSFLGRPVMLLTTIGHKSGKPRTQPVYFMRDGQRIVLVASNGGSPDDPFWLLNIQENPLVSVAVHGNSQKMTSRIVTAEEKAQLWPRLTEMFPMWQEVEDRCQRRFPVVLLEPVAKP